MERILSAFEKTSNYPVGTAEASVIIFPVIHNIREPTQEIHMLFDQMDQEMVKALIETIPAEITVIDANDEVVGWNKHETRLFKRPRRWGSISASATPKRACRWWNKLSAK